MRKPAGTTGRVRRLLIDGAPVDGNRVPAAAAGSTVRVEAEIS